MVEGFGVGWLIGYLLGPYISFDFGSTVTRLVGLDSWMVLE